MRSEEHTSELQSLTNLVCRLLLEKKKHKSNKHTQWYTQSNKKCIYHSHEQHQYHQHKNKTYHDGVNHVIQRSACCIATISCINNISVRNTYCLASCPGNLYQ